MLFIHPPLCIVGYGFLLAAFLANIAYKPDKKTEWDNRLRAAIVIAWLLMLGGIFTGAIWAQMAWGSYWSWDPKETASLVLFIFMSIYGAIIFAKPKWKWVQLGAGVAALVSVVLTISMNWLISGLHSYV